MTLLYVMPPGLPSSSMEYSLTPLPIDYGELQQEAGRRVLESSRRIAASAIATAEHVDVKSELVIATPVPTLVDLTKDAQMIVVGSGVGGAWRRGLFGSVSTGLVHHAHCPVAVIRAEDDQLVHDDGPVVVGIDGSPASELATAIAFDEASWRGVGLVAIHAWVDSDSPAIPRSLSANSSPRPRRPCRSVLPAGATATPTSGSTSESCSTSPPATCSRRLSLLNCSRSAATAAEASRECCWVQFVAPSCTQLTPR